MQKFWEAAKYLIMKIPLSLIKSYIDLDLSPEKIAESLTLLGIEVEKIEQAKPSFSHVVVGYIESVAPHPSADKLRVAQVDDGKEVHTVVCGASNCRKGIKTAFAKVGASLLDKKGQEYKITKATLRGVESFGMLCSEEELLLPSTSEGIMELPLDWNTGDDLRGLLWDPVFEISLTPNLGHVMSALGIARELSAFLQKPLKNEALYKKEEKSSQAWQVEISEKALCPIYFAAEIKNVQIAPSPFWLQRTLVAAGMKPISNAVDIGNYILLKTGQPLHIFDKDALEGTTLFVEKTKKSNDFLGLDGNQREIPEGILTISDSKGPVAIAGILGAERGSTKDSTQNLLIEAALFDPKIIRHGMKKLDLRTESSQRFEKGIDPANIQKALSEAIFLIEEICKGNFSGISIEHKQKDLSLKKISCRPNQVNALLGSHLSISEIEEIFHRLGLLTEEKENHLEVTIPSYRLDLNQEIDLIEEIARIYGYNQLEEDHLRKQEISKKPCSHDPAYLFEKKIRPRFLELGLQEILTSDLISPKLSDLAKEWLHPNISLLKAMKPKSEDYSILRPSLLPSMMEVALHNLHQKNFHLSLFEIGNIHLLENQKLLEQSMGAILLTGDKEESHWNQKPVPYDFFDLKGMVEILLESLQLTQKKKGASNKDPTTEEKESASFHFAPSNHPSFQPYVQANLFCENQCIGSLGKIHPHLLEKLGIDQPLFYAEINLDLLREFVKERLFTKPLPKFPSSTRDWTIPVDLKTHLSSITDFISCEESRFLEKVELIDLYEPKEGKEKMLTFRFTYRDPSKTLSCEEVDHFHQSLMEKVTQKLKN